MDRKINFIPEIIADNSKASGGNLLDGLIHDRDRVVKADKITAIEPETLPEQSETIQATSEDQTNK
jgi:hypothetical protein